jgi:N-acyl-D-amino-acid deacylase
MAYDTLLKNARIVDGTGAPWFHGSVAIRDGRIEAVHRNQPVGREATETVDLEGLMLAPGFVDLHSHSDLRLFAEPELRPKTMQGVTTEILGQDGFSMAPMYREGGQEEWEEHLSGLDGRPGRPWTWGSVADYFDAIERSGVAPNVATLVGHGTVRYNVTGMDDRAPTDAELEEMADLVTEALEDGAIGFSTGLDYMPQVVSDTEELQTLAGRLRDYGRPFVAHIRNQSDDIWNALDEFVDIGAEEEIPLHLSHFKLMHPPQHGRAQRAIGLLETARDRGVDITADQYPYTAGSTMLAADLPSWTRSDGPEATLDHLENDREPIREHLEREVSNWENIVITSVASDANERLVGMNMDEIAEELIQDIPEDVMKDPAGAVMNLLLEEELEVERVYHFAAEEDVRDILEYERAAVATDALLGGEPHPRTYGTYPRVLGHYARDENLFSVEKAVRLMTSLPARVVGLSSKGVLKPEMDADLVAFDPHNVDDPATYENPRQFPEGMPHVMVDGEFIVRDGESTGVTPGTAIRA